MKVLSTKQPLPLSVTLQGIYESRNEDQPTLGTCPSVLANAAGPHHI